MQKIDVRSLTMDQVEFDRFEDLETELDLGPLEMKRQVSEDFDDLVAQQKYRSGKLYDLTKLRLMMKVGGHLRLTNTYSGPRDEGYHKRIGLLVRKGGFSNVQIQTPNGPDGPEIIEGVRRPPFEKKLRFNLRLIEMIKPAEIEFAHTFAKKVYYNLDYNYDVDVARQFDLHSDVLAVIDSGGNFLSLGRGTHTVPGYYIPCMYAVDERGEHPIMPDDIHSYAEVMAIHQEGKLGVIAYKHLMEGLFQFADEVYGMDCAWTTVDVNDTYMGLYYKTRYRMKEYGSTLTYRDFGGNWILLYTRQIHELGTNPKKIFG